MSRLFQCSHRPRVYVAGKIGKNDFRHDLAPDLRGWKHEDGPIDCGSFIYVGPFFRACDHGCNHGPGTHGVAIIGCDGLEISRRAVFGQNQAALASADLVFAYIDAPDAYGTIWELGWAACAGIPAYLLFSPGVHHDDFWYASLASLARRPKLCFASELPAAFCAVLADWRCRQ